MKLRRKTIVAVALTTVSMISILYVASQTILLDSFAKLEEQNDRHNVEQVLSALSNEFAELNSKCGDWAEWDDTYAYVSNLSDVYKQSNLVPASFSNIRINFMLFINSSGQVVSSMAYDFQNMTELFIPQGLLQLVSTNDMIWRHQDVNSSATGIVLLSGNPLLLASRPILTSQREGPIRGALVFARYYNDEEVKRLGDTVHLPLAVSIIGDSQLSSDVQVASSSLSETKPIFVNPLNADSVAGYALVNDIFGQPILVLRAEMMRDIYKQGQASVSYFVLLLFLSCLVFGAMTILLLEKSFLSRLTDLTAEVISTEVEKGGLSRVPITGNDELSTLASSINGLLAEIEDKNAKLQKSERFSAIGELATMVAHDLRNPLQGISNAAFYLKRKMGSRMDNKEHEMLKLIEEDVRYSDKIVNDLLDYSWGMRLELGETSPVSLMKEALSMVEVPATIKVSDETQNEPTIVVDVHNMKRAFVNIIKNAIESMPAGGTLTLKSKVSNRNICFVFSDNGCGISEENLGKLFTPFFTTKAKGMGIGLSICKRIVEAHGGAISVESTSGKGTMFTVAIPIKSELEGGETEWMDTQSSSLLTTTKA